MSLGRSLALLALLTIGIADRLAAAPVVPEIRGIPYDTTEPDGWPVEWTSNVFDVGGNYHYEYLFYRPDYCGECIAENFWYSLGEAREESFEVTGAWPGGTYAAAGGIAPTPPVLGLLTVLFSIDGFDVEHEVLLPRYYFSRSMEVWVPANPVPEPSTMALILAGASGYLFRRRRIRGALPGGGGHDA